MSLALVDPVNPKASSIQSYEESIAIGQQGLDLGLVLRLELMYRLRAEGGEHCALGCNDFYCNRSIEAIQAPTATCRSWSPAEQGGYPGWPGKLMSPYSRSGLAARATRALARSARRVKLSMIFRPQAATVPAACTHDFVQRTYEPHRSPMDQQ